jgi:hypothetical protein
VTQERFWVTLWSGFVGLVMFRVLIFISLLSSCEQGSVTSNDPKGILKAYIEKSFNVSKAQERKDLEAYLTGPARTRLSVWSDDQFREAFIDSKRKFVKLNFREYKKISEQEVNITYELVYSDINRNNQSRLTTNKKLCSLIRDGDSWKIQNVKNIKELIEYQNELALP